VEIKSDEKIRNVDVTFTLLNLTITFQFGNSGILVGDGKPLADAIEDYKDLCDKKGINMWKAMDAAVTIAQLRQSDLICNILIKIFKLEEENVIQISTLPTVQLPVSAQEEALPATIPPEEDALQVLDPIPYSDEGVDTTQITDSVPDPLMKPDQGVPLNPRLTEDAEIKQPTDDSNNEMGIFPHKFIFKDIVIGGADVQKTAAEETPATKSIFSVCETVGPP
jgi:hypothetical protein